MLGLRDRLWKYIEPDLVPHPRYSPLGELYDLGRDLGETNNLVETDLATGKKMLHELNNARQAPSNP
jgi:hypothetical protein